MKGRKCVSLLLVFLLVFTTFSGIWATSEVKAAGNGEKYVINIIWDGLSTSMFNRLKDAGLNTPNIDILIENGTKIDNLKTTVPSYGGAQAALITGAYPETNGFLYRYFDKASNAVISSSTQTYKFNAQTIFEAILNQNSSIKTLVTGFNVAGLSLDGRGVSKTGDENHKLLEYKTGDNLVSFYDTASSATGNDIIKAINSLSGVPNYMLAYSNDIKMAYWGGGAADSTVADNVVNDKILELDEKLGEIVEALKNKGIYDETIIILNSLSSVYTTKTKVDGSLMAADITNKTGVQVEFNGGGAVKASPQTKAVIVKTYVMKYAQLYFTNSATQVDKEKVLAYLNDNSTAYGKYVKEVLNSSECNAPAAFADYIINPIDIATFSAASAGVFRTDNLDDLNLFCVISGTGLTKNAAIAANVSVADIASNVSYLLGINPPVNNQGARWDVFNFTKPSLQVKQEGFKDQDGKYQSSVVMSAYAIDDNPVKIYYDTGKGYSEYQGATIINTDCTLKVKAVDAAGNTVEEVYDIKFVQLLDEISLLGSYDLVNDTYYTDSDSITVSGRVYLENPGVKVNINDAGVLVESKSFNKNISLLPGPNNINVQVLFDGIGNSVVKHVYKVYDPIILSIQDGVIVNDSMLNVKGNSVPGSLVKVNGNYADIDQNGSFETQLNLTEGENLISLVSNVGKYEGTTNLKVYYYTPVKMEITNYKDRDIVKTDRINILGTVDKPCYISVNGDNGTYVENGSFSREVQLTGGLNTLKVDASINGITTSKSIKVNYVQTDDNYVVYINWDGFAWYYYQKANVSGKVRTPVINDLVSKGVLFTNANTGIPSITNAMQAAIVAGAWPATTGNGYRYFDKASNSVIQFTRENTAETIAEATARQGLKVASINQFALENRGTAVGDPNKPYITSGGDESYLPRFDAAIKLIKGEPAGVGSSQIVMDEIPRFLALYMDDLDGIGHNEKSVYGLPVAATELERLENVLTRLEKMDAKLGEFINACKERNIYDNMTFVLTTDHGMSPFGNQGDEIDDYTYSKLPDIIDTLKSLGYSVESLLGGQQAAPDTDIVIVSVGLQAQVSLVKDYTDADVQKIIDAVKDKPYLGRVMKKDEMEQRGALDGFADLIISPKPPYSFKTGDPKPYTARGQHDSLDETAQHIFSLMWGKNVKQGFNYSEKMYNIDVTPTMAALLGIDGPKDATGRVLSYALEGIHPGNGDNGQSPYIPVEVKNPEDVEQEKVNKLINDTAAAIKADTSEQGRMEKARELIKTVSALSEKDIIKVEKDGIITVSIKLEAILLKSENLNCVIKLLAEAGIKDLAGQAKMNIVLNLETVNADEYKIKIPSGAIQGLTSKGLGITILAGGTELETPSSAYTAMIGKSTDSKNEVEVIVKKYSENEDGNFKEAIDSMKTKNSTFNSMGSVYEFKFDGNSSPTEDKTIQAKIRVTVKLPYDDKKVLNNGDKLGIYSYDQLRAKWTYIGGIVDKNTGKIEVDAAGTGVYMVMEHSRTFDDVDSHWAKEDIELMASKFIIHGVDDTNFNPDSTVTRAEFAAMMVKALRLDTENYKNSFYDISRDDWFAGYIQAAADAGIIQGDGSNFRPNDYITREEMAKVIMQVYKLESGVKPVGSDLEKFEDKDRVSGWAVEYIKEAYALGLLQGVSDTRLEPDVNASRAQAVVIVKRLLEAKSKV